MRLGGWWRRRGRYGGRTGPDEARDALLDVGHLGHRETLALTVDDSVAVDPNGEGRCAAGVVHRDHLGLEVGDDGEGDAKASGRGASFGDCVGPIHGDAHHHQAPAVLLKKSLVDGKFLKARLAPCCPEEHHHRASMEVVGKTEAPPEGVPWRRRKRELLCGRARGRQGRHGMEGNERKRGNRRGEGAMSHAG